MGKKYNFIYKDRIPKILGGGKTKIYIECGSYYQYKIELKDIINALRRELDGCIRKEAK